MQKKLIIFIFILFIVIPGGILYAKSSTIEDLNNQAEAAQKEYEEKQKELDAKQMEYDDVEAEFSQVSADNKKLVSEVVETENNIAQKEVEINDLQNNKIPKMEEQAGLSLLILQENKNSKFLLESVYNSFKDNDESVIETINNSKNLFIGLKDSLLNLVDLLDKVKEEEENLKNKKLELEAQQKEQEAQESYLAGLKRKLSNIIADVEKDIADAKDIAEYNKNLADLAAQNGCGPTDVIGVDCATESVPSSTGFIKPMPSGYITQEYSQSACWNPGYVGCRHAGIDVGGNAEGTAVYPVASGQVLYSGYMSDGGGNSVMILHVVDGKNYVSRYCHLQYTSVSVGQTVTTTTQIGGIGHTGNVTAKHLHLEMQQGSRYVWANTQNPRNFINFPSIGVRWSNR